MAYPDEAWEKAPRPGSFEDKAARYPGFTLTENTAASARFSLDPVLVTGDTPDELEAQAIARARADTGLADGLLEVYSPYTLYVAANYAHLPDSQVQHAIRVARAVGAKLTAKIAVIGYREVNDDEPRDVDRGAVHPADPAGVRAAADPGLAGELGALEEAS